MGIKEDIVEIQKFVDWIKTRYVPVWEYNSQLLTGQLSSFDAVKDGVSDFKTLTEISLRKFEKDLAEIKQKIEVALTNLNKDAFVKIEESLSRLLELIQLQVKKAMALKKTCDYKNIDVKDIFEQNSKLYKPFNEYFWVMYSKIIKKVRGKTNFLTFLKYGRKYFDIHFKKPKIRTKIEIDNKTINVTIFYDLNFSFSRTKIDYPTFKGSSKDLIKTECQKIINEPFDSPLKKRAYEILTKTDYAILEEFAHGMLENLIAVLRFNAHLIKATNTNLNIRISHYGAKRAAFLHEGSSFNYVLIGIDLPAFLGFYIYNENFDKEPINVHLPIAILNPYTTLSHELSHFFDILNVNYSSQIEIEAAKLVGKNFSVQSFLLVNFISNIRKEGFATLNEEFTRALHPNESYAGLNFLRLGTDARTNGSYKESLTKLKQDITSLMTKKPLDAGKLYQEVLKAQHYEQGKYICIILLLDMLIRIKKTEQTVIINQDIYNKILVSTSHAAKDYEECQNLLKLPAKELLTKFNIDALSLNQIGTYLTQDSIIYIEKPDWNTVYQLIVKISNMNLIKFFDAYEKACDNLSIPKDLRLSAIEEIKEAQQTSRLVNDKLMKQEGFLQT